ncbi:MAG: flagellar biosynthetic protein FliR [Bacillota bacterium]|uniref:flagellar biosynthetic protein FliR n=1 Tax=Desulfurispora thermophila TaxID=265470 RepID=UPI00036DF0B2|nr:flagellar biosynthetic protein FliR [Desulfurispora thermophila]
MVLSETYVVTFLLVLVRLSTALVFLPVTAGPSLPRQFRLIMAVLLAAMLTPIVSPPQLALTGWLVLVPLAAREVLVGLAMGAVAGFVLHSLLIAGQYIDMHIGLLMANILDPLSGGQITLLAKFIYMLGLAMFLALNGHHLLIAALYKSFQLVPPGTALLKGSTALLMVRVFADMLALGVQLALPVVAVVLLVDIALGLVGRTAPQMNIFMLGFPLKIIAGFLTLLVVSPLLGRFTAGLMRLLENDLYLLLKGLS